jgi:anti-anti-sigma factor
MFPGDEFTHSSTKDAFRVHQFSGDKTCAVPYTDRTMAFDTPLKIEPVPGSKPGTVILRLIGPVTLNNVSPLRALFRGTDPPHHTILDLSGVPFVDSAGMSEIINHEIYCRDKHVQLSLAGVTPRVLSMFHTTRLEQVLTLAATVEEAEART